MQASTFDPLRTAACAVVLTLALTACSSPHTVSVKPPAEPPARSAAVEVATPAAAPAEISDVTLIDPSPERLVLGARYGQAQVVDYLLDGGMAVDARDPHGNTALIAAAGNGQKQMVLNLLARGADINASNHNKLTALMGAAVNGDYQLVHQLLKMGAESNARNNDGEAALHMAVKYGHYRAARVLLNGGANPNLHNRLRPAAVTSGFTPLMYAASHGVTREPVDWVAMAELLLNNGADPNLTSTHGETALNHARKRNDQAMLALLGERGAKDEHVYAGLSGNERLIKAARIGDVNKLGQLLRDGINPNVADRNGVLPLLAAAFEGHAAALAVLVTGGAEINYVPAGLSQFALAKSHAPLNERELMEAASRGDTALHLAIRRGHHDAAALLLDEGARLDLANRHGEPPLMLAVAGGDPALVRLLLDRGADPDTVEQDNRPNRATLARQATGRDSVLIKAAQRGHEQVARALLEAGADPDHRGVMGKTALFSAVENGHPALVSLLLERQADADLKTLAGVTPLMEAARLGSPEMVAALLQHGAAVNAIEQPELGYVRQEQAGSGSGMTALMFAARGGHGEVVTRLLRAGAHANLHNAHGQKASDLAATAGHQEIVRLLSSGAASESVTLSVTGG